MYTSEIELKLYQLTFNNTGDVNWDNLVLSYYGQNHKHHINGNENDAVDPPHLKVLHHYSHKLEGEAEEEEAC